MRRVAVVLFNLGGPDAPEAVRPFLENLFTDPAILQPFGRSKFVPADNAEYAPVEAVAKSAGLLD